MLAVLQDARELHSVTSAQHYALQHARFIAEKRRHGHRVEVHDSTPLQAYVNHGSWVVDCECGAGNAVGWGVARCFHCGAVHEVKLPREAEKIAQVLVQRPSPVNRNWYPGESLAVIRGENRKRGVA